MNVMHLNHFKTIPLSSWENCLQLGEWKNQTLVPRGLGTAALQYLDYDPSKEDNEFCHLFFVLLQKHYTLSH